MPTKSTEFRAEGLFLPDPTQMTYLPLGDFLHRMNVMKAESYSPTENDALMLQQERSHLNWRKKKIEESMREVEGEIPQAESEAQEARRKFHAAITAALATDDPINVRAQLRALGRQLFWREDHPVRARLPFGQRNLPNDLASKYFPDIPVDDIGFAEGEDGDVENRFYRKSEVSEPRPDPRARLASYQSHLDCDINLRLAALDECLRKWSISINDEA